LFMDKFYLITICDDVRFGLINVDFKWTHPRTISYYVSCPRLLWKLNDDSRHKLSRSTYDFCVYEVYCLQAKSLYCSKLARNYRLFHPSPSWTYNGG
jgi:hypothetical protein